MVSFFIHRPVFASSIAVIMTLAGIAASGSVAELDINPLLVRPDGVIGLDADLLDQIFAVQIRDFSGYAVALHGKPSSTSAQQDWALAAVRKPTTDAHRFDRVWEKVRAYDGAYEMRP